MTEDNAKDSLIADGARELSNSDDPFAALENQPTHHTSMTPAPDANPRATEARKTEDASGMEELEELRESAYDQVSPVDSAADEPRGDTMPLGEISAAPSVSFLRPGTKIDARYVVASELGAGGMGRVYKSADTKFDPPRDVAIKLLRSHMRDSEVNEARFLAEAALPAQLNHPNIVTVYDVGTYDEDQLYYVMEFIPHSASLQDVVNQAIRDQEYLPLDQIKIWFVQAARALKKLHARAGAWHRDIKLDNLLVFEEHDDHFLKLIDFGIAHQPDSNLTAAGNLLGTPSYMSPEYFEQDAQLDYRSDLFALGIALYTTVTLRHPYPAIAAKGDHRSAMLQAISDYRDPSSVPYLPSVFRDDLAPGWDTLIMGLLKRNRDERYQTAADFQQDLMNVEQLPSYEGTDARTEEDYERANSTGTAPDGVSSTELLGDAARGNTAPPAPGSAASVPIAAPPRPSYPGASIGKPLTPQQSLAPPPPAPAAAASASMPSALLSRSTPNPLPLQGSVDNSDWAEALSAPPEAAKKRAAGRFILAGVVALIVLVGAGVAAYQLNGFKQPGGEDSAGFTMPGEPEPEEPKDWTKGLKGKPIEADALAVSPTPSPKAKTSDEEFKERLNAEYAKKPSRRSRRSSTRASANVPTESAEGKSAEPASEWERLYGSGATNSGALAVRSDAPDAGKAVAVEGMQLSARLMDNVASSPSNAPVIARIDKKVTIGRSVVPAGSEIHGRTRGSKGTRVFIDFRFIRRKHGAPIQLSAVAKGRDGRLGVPGNKLVDGRIGGAIAAEGAGSAVKGAANELAEATGDAIGSEAIRSMGSEAKSKKNRFDEDENVVLAKRGTRFVVYMQSLEAD